MKLCALILSLLFPPPAKQTPPSGWLECGFTVGNVYRCQP